MMKTLDWYLGRSVLQTTGFALLVLVGISTLIKFIDQLKSVGRGSYDLMTAMLYTLYSIPGDLVIFFPMAALIGGLTGLGALASNSELVVMQAAGMSRLQIIGSVMKTAVFMASGAHQKRSCMPKKCVIKQYMVAMYLMLKKVFGQKMATILLILKM